MKLSNQWIWTPDASTQPSGVSPYFPAGNVGPLGDLQSQTMNVLNGNGQGNSLYFQQGQGGPVYQAPSPHSFVGMLFGMLFGRARGQHRGGGW
jgi:hypothetical protein